MARELYEFNAVVLKVVDGDTIDFDVDLGFTVHVNIRTRLIGINAPEVSTPEGRLVRDLVRAWYPLGLKVTIRTYKAAGDKYGRWLAEVSADHLEDNTGNLSLNDYLVLKQLAVAQEY